MSADKLIEGAVLVPRPVREHTLTELGMRSSVKEIPDPLERWGPGSSSLKPDGWWLSEGAFFDGPAWPINSYGELAAPQPTQSATCTAAFCIARGRLLAIVSPNNASEPAIWVNVACSRVRVATGGDGGVALNGDRWEIRVIRVSRLYRHMTQKGLRAPEVHEKFQTGQERSLLEEVAKAAQIDPGYTTVDPTPEAPPLGSGYNWLPQAALGGLYRLTRMGKPTSVTSLVDRELPVERQLAALREAEWVPRHIAAKVTEAIREHATPKLYRPTLPEERLVTPFMQIYLLGILNDQPATHPVSRYLWPSLTGGELSLDQGEQAVASRTVPEVRLARYSSPEDRGVGVDFGEANTVRNPRIYLTNRRLVVIAERDPTKIDDDRQWWGLHFREEWISELGITEKTVIKKAGIRQKEVGRDVTHAPYARLVLPAGTVNEISFPEATDGSAIAARVSEILGARVAATESTSATETKSGSRARRYRAVSGAVPYSLPLRLAMT